MADEQDQKVEATEAGVEETPKPEPVVDTIPVAEFQRVKAELDAARRISNSQAGLLREAQRKAASFESFREELGELRKSQELLLKERAGQEVDIPKELAEQQNRNIAREATQGVQAFAGARSQKIQEVLAEAGLSWEDPRLAEAHAAVRQYQATGDVSWMSEAHDIAAKVAVQAVKAAAPKPHKEPVKLDLGGPGSAGMNRTAYVKNLQEGKPLPSPQEIDRIVANIMSQR